MICFRPWTMFLAVSLAAIVVACTSLSLAAKRPDGTGASAGKASHASAHKAGKGKPVKKKASAAAKAGHARKKHVKPVHSKSGLKKQKTTLTAKRKGGTKNKKATAVAKAGKTDKKSVRSASASKKSKTVTAKAVRKPSGKTAKTIASSSRRRKSASSRKRAKAVAAKRRVPPKPLIVIDPGHGGHDPGAMAAGLMEKRITLSVAKMLRDRLIKAGFRVKLTRSSDRTLTPKARVRIATRLKPALFLSLHCNSAPAASENGIETFAFLPKRLHDGRCSVVPIEEVGLANCSASQASFLHRELATKVKAKGMRENGVRLGRFAVLTPKPWPSVLIEMGYLTNKRDAKRLASKKYRAWFADRLAEVLQSRFKKSPGVLLAGPDSRKKSHPPS